MISGRFTCLAVLLLGVTCSAFSHDLPEASQRRAVVKAVRGSATYTTPAGQPRKLLVGMQIREGDVIQTDAETIVDLFLGENGVVRVTPNTRLRIEKLRAEHQGAKLLTQTILDVPQGRILTSGPRQKAGAIHEIRTVADRGHTL